MHLSASIEAVLNLKGILQAAENQVISFASLQGSACSDIEISSVHLDRVMPGSF